MPVMLATLKGVGSKAVLFGAKGSKARAAGRIAQRGAQRGFKQAKGFGQQAKHAGGRYKKRFRDYTSQLEDRVNELGNYYAETEGQIGQGMMQSGMLQSGMGTMEQLTSLLKIIFYIVLFYFLYKSVTSVYAKIAAVKGVVKTATGVFGNLGAGCGDNSNHKLADGTCCRADFNCNNHYSCMYCANKHSFSIVGGQGEGENVFGSHKGKYCSSSAACGDYSKVDFKNSNWKCTPRLLQWDSEYCNNITDKDQCKKETWNPSKFPETSFFVQVWEFVFGKDKDNVAYKYAQAVLRFENYVGNNKPRCVVIEKWDPDVLGDPNDPNSPGLEGGTCCRLVHTKAQPHECIYCKHGHMFSLVGNEGEGANVTKYDMKYCATSAVCKCDETKYKGGNCNRPISANNTSTKQSAKQSAKQSTTQSANLQINKIQQAPKPKLQGGTCCAWNLDALDPNSCLYCEHGNTWSLVGGEAPGANVKKYNMQYCSTSRVCTDS